MDDDIELYGRKITWDEVIIMMKDISKTMEHNADIFNKHVKIMETLSELVNTIKLYQKKDKLTIEERKFLLAMMGNQAFHVATHGGIPREEKVELFEMLAHEYKFFKEIFNRALEVTHDFHDMWPLMTKVSDRVSFYTIGCIIFSLVEKANLQVRNAYLLILRMTMDQWDRQSVKNLDAKVIVFIKRRSITFSAPQSVYHFYIQGS